MPEKRPNAPSKKFLEAHTGDDSQVAGVRRFCLEEGRAAGSSFAEVWTGGGLRFTVALGRALDISDAFYNGKSLCGWHHEEWDKLLKQRNDENFASITELVGLLGDGAKLTKAQLTNLVDFTLAIKQEEQMAFLKKLPNPILSKLGTASEDLCNAIAAIAHEMDKELGRK